MFETIAWISIIIGFVAVISISLAAMLITRRREQQAPPAVDYDEAVRKVDAAADAALSELNKMAELVLKDIDEKYQALLFLYELLEEKQKKKPAAMPVLPAVKSPVISARHERIIALYNEGMPAPDIAKELDIGQGEVKLIISLMERGRGA